MLTRSGHAVTTAWFMLRCRVLTPLVLESSCNNLIIVSGFLIKSPNFNMLRL